MRMTYKSGLEEKYVKRPRQEMINLIRLLH